MDLTKKTSKYKKSEFYDTSSGVVKRKNKFCPKCGPGVFMAEHKDRFNCGACGFTDMKSKAPIEEHAHKEEHKEHKKE